MTNQVYEDLKELETAYKKLSCSVASTMNLISFDKKEIANAYDQVRAERDMALSQLKEIGKCLGENMDDVKPVVHSLWIYDLEITPSSPVGPEEIDWAGWRCRECREAPTDDRDWDNPEDPPLMKYCPNCGAIIDATDPNYSNHYHLRGCKKIEKDKLDTKENADEKDDDSIFD